MALALADLFCGVGGFSQAFHAAGFDTAFACDTDRAACDTFEANFDIRPAGDVFQIDIESLPWIDVVTAGFPCQPFSKAGKLKGFDDPRGGAFFGLKRVVRDLCPRAVVLENVQGLQQHDGGGTLRRMRDLLYEDGYETTVQLLDATDFGGVQHRRRLFVVGSLGGRAFDFDAVERTQMGMLRHILEPADRIPADEWLEPEEYTLLPHDQWKRARTGLIFAGYLNKRMRVEGGKPWASRNHRQHNRIYSSLGIAQTLASQESSGRFWVEIDGRVRRFTRLECARLMGFSDDFRWPVPGRFYQLCGNSVHVPTVRAVAAEVRRQLFPEA